MGRPPRFALRRHPGPEHPHPYRGGSQRHPHRAAVRGLSTFHQRAAGACFLSAIPPLPLLSSPPHGACHPPAGGGACPFFFGASPCLSIPTPPPPTPTARPRRANCPTQRLLLSTSTSTISSPTSTTNYSTPPN